MNVRSTEHETLVTSSAQDRSWYLHRLMPESAEQNRGRQHQQGGPASGKDKDQGGRHQSCELRLMIQRMLSRPHPSSTTKARIRFGPRGSVNRSFM